MSRSHTQRAIFRFPFRLLSPFAMAEIQLANTSIHDLDASLTKDILYTRLVHILANNAMYVLHCKGTWSLVSREKDSQCHLTKLGRTEKYDRDEIGILPFLPDKEKEQEHSLIDSTDILQYPFIVQEHGTKLGIPIFCWVPVLDAAYTELKSAIRPTSSSATNQNWWNDHGTSVFWLIALIRLGNPMP